MWEDIPVGENAPAEGLDDLPPYALYALCRDS
jgi:hypothetical protein